MGNTESNQDSQSGRNGDFLNKYFIVKKLVDQKFGECTILQDKQNSQQCIMREINSTDLDGHKKEQKKYEDRINFSNPNIVRLLGFFDKQESQFCSTFYKSYLIFEYLNNSLEQEFSIRRQQQQSFSEQELWSLLTGSVLGLLYLQKNNITNQNLKPSTIYIDNEGIVKIMDPAFFNQMNNFATILTNKTGSFKSIYIAPALLNSLENENWQPVHDPYKSDVFTLGMIILHASLMENLDCCYKYENFQLKNEVLENKLQKLHQNFSQEFCNIIMVMLQFDQEERPNFYQLEDYFNKLQVFQQSPEKQQQVELSIVQQQVDEQQFNGKKSHKQHVQPSQPKQQTNIPAELDNQCLQNSQVQGEQIKRHGKHNLKDEYQLQKAQKNVKVLEDISSHSKNQTNQSYACNLKRDNDDKGSQINFLPVDQNIKLSKPDENIADQFDNLPSARDNFQNDIYKQEEYNENQNYQSQIEDKENCQNSEMSQSQQQYQLSYNHKYEQKYEQQSDVKEYEPEQVDNQLEENIQQSKYKKTAKNYYAPPLHDKTNQAYTKSYVMDKKYETQLDIEEILKKYTVKEDKSNVHESSDSKYKSSYQEYRKPESQQSQVYSKHSFKDTQLNQILVEPKEYSQSYFKSSKVQENTQKSNYSPSFQNQDYMKDYKLKYQKSETFQFDKDTTTTDKNQESNEQEVQNESSHQISASKNEQYQSEQKFQQYDQQQNRDDFEDNQDVQSVEEQYEDQDQEQYDQQYMDQQKDYNSQNGYKGTYINLNKIEDVIENYQNGSRYEGEKVNDMRHGLGKFFYQDGGLYDGEWKENKMHGKGILYYASGTPAYDGEWFEDKFEGFGVLYNENPEDFNEPFDYNDFDLVEELWERYDGEFRDDNKEGYGTLYLSNGEKFQGTFKQDIINGSGTFYQLDGTCIEGTWMNNKLNY